jgi:DNA-directed RNA polymerase specialized sigma24 family protein
MERRVSVRGRARAPRDGGHLLRPARPPEPDHPFAALLDAWLDPATPAARWAVVVGDAALARAVLDDRQTRRDLLIVRTGQPDADALLADLSPVLGRLLDDLTPSQRRVARLVLVEGLRQADAATVLGISRASVSVAHARAHLREIGLLLRAIRAAWTAGARLSAVERSSPVDRGATVRR